jgi:ferredoxin
VANSGSTLFGVNLADGRIKGYGLTMPGPGSVEKTFFVLCARDNTSYGQNDLADNGDGTITDQATGLMWSQDDSSTGLNWEEALSWVETQNAANYLGYSDWRLPNAKELQSIVDYSRSPDTTDSAAIDPLFSATTISNEAGQTDYPSYWSSTTHANWTADPGAFGVYVAFGRGALSQSFPRRAGIPGPGIEEASDMAIELIDPRKCIGCGTCVETYLLPTSCIRMFFNKIPSIGNIA